MNKKEMGRNHFGLSVKTFQSLIIYILHLSIILCQPWVVTPSTLPYETSSQFFNYSIILLVFSLCPIHVPSSFFHKTILPAISFLLLCQHTFHSSFRTPVRSQEVFPDPIGGALSLTHAQLKFIRP